MFNEHLFFVRMHTRGKQSRLYKWNIGKSRGSLSSHPPPRVRECGNRAKQVLYDCCEHNTIDLEVVAHWYFIVFAHSLLVNEVSCVCTLAQPRLKQILSAWVWHSSIETYICAVLSVVVYPDPAIQFVVLSATGKGFSSLAVVVNRIVASIGLGDWLGSRCLAKTLGPRASSDMGGCGP